jgi:ribokinase
MIGRVGNDDFGARLRETLTTENVNCDHVQVSENVGTGVAVVTVVGNGDNTIVLAPGANALLDEVDIKRATPLFKIADAALFQLEVPLPAVEAGLTLARKTGCHTVLTPAPAQALPLTLWKAIDYVVLNETELAFYAGYIHKNEPSGEAGDKDRTVAEAAGVLLSRGTKGVVVTRGARGGLVVTKREFFPYAPFKVKAVDSTGAGDSFCAALIVALSEGMPLEQAVRFASAAGALACTRFGAHPSLPWRREVVALQEANA